MAKQVTVRVKSDTRPDAWGYEASQRMHEKLASQADRSTAQRDARKAARAQRKAERSAA